jgi:hypothetical protein
MRKEEIENKIREVFWLIIDILEENDIHERTSDMIINDIIPNCDYWEYGYSVYKNDKSGVIDRIRIKTKSRSKYNNLLEELNSEKSRIEDIIGIKIQIDPYEPNSRISYDTMATINIILKWKSLSNRIDDFKSFVKFILK